MKRYLLFMVIILENLKLMDEITSKIDLINERW